MKRFTEIEKTTCFKFSEGAYKACPVRKYVSSTIKASLTHSKEHCSLAILYTLLNVERLDINVYGDKIINTS